MKNTYARAAVMRAVEPTEPLAQQLADRWSGLMNEVNRYGAGRYPDLLYVEILRLLRDTEQLTLPDPFQTDLLFTARELVRTGYPKVAMFKLEEAISARLHDRFHGPLHDPLHGSLYDPLYNRSHHR